MKLRTFLLLVICFLFQMFSSAQQNRFLYIQTENKQPFYVNLNNNIFSSSASGYLIIPKLQEGTYQLTIGFPKNEWPRQLITYNIGKKDEGVLLKNFGGQGWGFYNLQNSETTMAAGNKPKTEVTGTVDDDSFTQVLSEVVNTPDLKIKSKVTDPAPAAVAEVKTAEEPAAKSSTNIIRLAENSNEQGREITYVDGVDTIRIFIPVSMAMVEQINPTQIDSVLIGQTSKPAEDKPSVTQPKTEAEKPVVVKTDETESKTTEVEVKKEEKPSPISMVNSDCKANASADDFMKLRKKMASEENEVKMVVVAKKAFKAKCYSTSQIKNLSVLFLNDSGRFQFFESAYPFVSDSNNFNGLLSQLTDPYYVTRFEAMIRR